jgi:hypothetical protein
MERVLDLELLCKEEKRWEEKTYDLLAKKNNKNVFFSISFSGRQYIICNILQNDILIIY